MSNSKLHWESFLFFAFYITLPSFFAVDLHARIPLITASRALLVLLVFCTLWRKRSCFYKSTGRFKTLNLFLTEDKLLRWGLCLYFVVLLAVNAAFVLQTSDAIKQIFVLLAEEYGLVWILCLLLDSRKKIIDALKCMVITAAAIGIFAGISVILEYNIFDILNTSSRDLVLRFFYRYGMLRPTCGFIHPVYYGAYCAVMLPLNMYFIDNAKTKNERRLFGICAALTLLGLVLANSRGSQLAFCLIAAFVFFKQLAKRDLKKLFKAYLPVIAVTSVLLLLVIALSPMGRSHIQYWVKSLAHSQSAAPNLDKLHQDTPDISVPTTPEFGENAGGLASRLDQLTGIRFTAERSPLLGFGPNAFAKLLVAYMYYPGVWSHVATVDVNLVAIIGQYGLIGLVGFLSLYSSLGISFLRKKYRKDSLMQYLFLSYSCYMLCLFSISFLDKWFWVLTGILLALVNVIGRESLNSDS